MRKIIILILLACAGYVVPAYFLSREDFGLQLLCFAFEFAIYIVCIRNFSFNLSITLLVCLLPRLVWISATPVMSDDYYRFYLDGALVNQGIDPYAHTPGFLANQSPTEGEMQEVVKKINSPHYYSSYPPLNQAWFALAASAGNLSSYIIITRLLLMLADMLVIILIYKFSQQRTTTFTMALAYGLNPLVITELTGNLHFEGICMMWWLLAIWWLHKNNYVLTVFTWALACCTKLVPLYLISTLWPVKKFWFAVLTGMLSVLILLLSFIILTDQQGIHNFKDSIGLYFNKFEFNASFYFIVRETGTWMKGYNPIASIAPALGILFILMAGFMMWRAWIKKINDIFLLSALLIGCYYLLSTTVHPWYSINLLIPGILAGLYFPIAWTGLIFLSYVFYTTGETSMYYLTVTLEYVALIAFTVWEWKQKGGLFRNFTAQA